MSRILVIGDVHLPAEHPMYLQFCKDIRLKWQCDTIVFMGDIIDHHSVSFHEADPDSYSPRAEYEITLKKIEQWKKAFPVAKVCIGNHDERIHRLAKSVMIISDHIVSYNKMWNTPKWDWQHEYIIDDIHFSHGVGCSGLNPAYNAMKKRAMSTVIGHCHSKAGVKFFCGPRVRMFGMDSGCGIDVDAVQMLYGRHMLEKPFLGCGVIIDGIPYYEPMPCGPKEKYRKRK